MQVSYRVPEVIVHETYIAFADIQLPEDVNAQGLCSDNVSRLLLDWGNKTFQVNLTFTRKDPDDESKNSTWSLAAIAISYDLSNTDVFKASTLDDIVTVERQHLSLFTTQVGNTYKCDSDVIVQVGSNERGVSVTFHDVRLAAFGVTSTEFPAGVELCSAADHASRHEEILVPLIVACCLSLVVVIIVIAYVISRKVQEAREQSEYRQMP
ncbi:unnamed protein product [Lymnaea stagnalis]|uniref:Lysosome-associated membrane glycoprotein 5 n=1 Tax=Lymnaea stagnalis TaxID=6523 RepID=A0AAV2H5X0_LYMST